MYLEKRQLAYDDHGQLMNSNSEEDLFPQREAYLDLIYLMNSNLEKDGEL